MGSWCSSLRGLALQVEEGRRGLFVAKEKVKKRKEKEKEEQEEEKVEGSAQLLFKMFLFSLLPGRAAVPSTSVCTGLALVPRRT